jgi:hypothetical protein
MSLPDDTSKNKIIALRNTIQHLLNAIEDARAMIAVQSPGEADVILSNAITDTRFEYK